jgi:hypothetical protein
MGLLADPRTSDEQFALVLRDLSIAQLRILALDFAGTLPEARARRLSEVLPPSLMDVRFEKGHPALAVGMANSELGQHGRLRTLKLTECGEDAVGMRSLATALERSGQQLQILNLWCALAGKLRRACSGALLAPTARVSVCDNSVLCVCLFD